VIEIRPDIYEKHQSLFGDQKVNGRTVNVENLIEQLTRDTKDEFRTLLGARHAFQEQVGKRERSYGFLGPDTKVSDAGLVHLAGMTRLESVNLSNTNVSDAGLAHLGRMPSLAGLNVTGTKVTDAGLVHLKPLPKLTKLNVSGTAVTAQGVKDAKKFLPFFATVTR